MQTQSIGDVGPHYWDPSGMNALWPSDIFQLGADGDVVDEIEKRRKVWWTVYGVLSPISAAASAYHGYKRNGTVGAAIGWAILGGLFPLITPAVGLAQGFGKRK